MPSHGRAAPGRGRTSSALCSPPGRGSNRAAARAPAARTAPAPAAASSNPTMSDLEDALDRLSLFTPFSSKWVLPTRVLSTQFIEGSKRCIIDCLIPNVHRSKVIVNMADDGMTLFVKVTIPDAFWKANASVKNLISGVVV